MKKPIVLAIAIGILFLGMGAQALAQDTDCVQCDGCTTTGTNASAIGKNTTASGNNAFAGGYNTIASGSNSFSFGYGSKATQSTNIALGKTALATGSGAMAIGAYVKASAQNSYAIGSGATSSTPLTNSTANSIALGINSNKPTILITKALNNNYTGKVAIGQVTAPQAKLHLKSDTNEDAGVFIETSNKSIKKAYINLFDKDHNLTVDPTGAMTVNAGGGMLNLVGDHYCFGNNKEPRTRFYTHKRNAIYVNASRVNDIEFRDEEAPSYAIDFNDDAICFRTALSQAPRGTEITNWNNALFIGTNGRIGIGSKDSFIQNKDDKQLAIQCPNQLDLNSTNITLNGKIGINTTNTLEDYALAVNGGMIATKVFIKEAKHWPDYVFSNDYPLLGLDDLKGYLEEHHHLPGMPSESQLDDEGYDLHQMQCLLMEKIEEMTRYILVLKEELDSLKEATKTNTFVQFEYDPCGNRISRQLTIERIPQQDESPNSTNDLSYEVFPNPTRGSFTILCKDPDGHLPLQATLLSPMGVLIEKRMIRGSQTQFDLSSQANGIYILMIDNPEGAQTWKVIKQ